MPRLSAGEEGGEEMILVKPSAEILAVTLDPLNLIERAGRTCYKSEDKITDESAPKFAEMILKRGHESVIEHAAATVRFICDRGVTHEIVRHRLASYSQESTRYCDYQGGHVCFVIPPWCPNLHADEYAVKWEQLYGTCWPVHSLYNEGSIDTSTNAWFWAVAVAEREYKRLRATGWKPEQARSVLPNSLKTEIVMTANLREWRHFFKLRTAPAAHPQMREVAIPLLAEFKKQVPVVFDDLEV
jgi:thymidylate synthase (FAD)